PILAAYRDVLLDAIDGYEKPLVDAGRGGYREGERILVLAKRAIAEGRGHKAERKQRTCRQTKAQTSHRPTAFLPAPRSSNNSIVARFVRSDPDVRPFTSPKTL